MGSTDRITVAVSTAKNRNPKPRSITRDMGPEMGIERKRYRILASRCWKMLYGLTTNIQYQETNN